MKVLDSNSTVLGLLSEGAVLILLDVELRRVWTKDLPKEKVKNIEYRNFFVRRYRKHRL